MTTPYIKHLQQTLLQAFPDATISIQDDSAAHAGHAGARPGGNTHFTIVITSTAFDGMPRVARHRLVYDALEKEWSGSLHALAITAQTPLETKKQA